MYTLRCLRYMNKNSTRPLSLTYLGSRLNTLRGQSIDLNFRQTNMIKLRTFVIQFMAASAVIMDAHKSLILITFAPSLLQSVDASSHQRDVDEGLQRILGKSVTLETIMPTRSI